MTDLPKQYEPKSAQERWLSFWDERGYFHANPNPEKPPHAIMIPLPNVTGALHMGHALNGTLQDLITRWRRMQGYEALWMPGTDHAGIATQAVVERRMLEEEGLTRHDIGREALVKRIWAWKDEYEKRILNQLKQLGASCDWRRTRFTLDEVCERAVRRTFLKMFKDGLIYRGKRLVNWDVHLQTAVADDEVFSEDVDGHFWTFTYPIVDDAGEPTGATIAFSTTRPETMLGDTAVCVHPSDERYTDIVGKNVQIPLTGRLIPVIADGILADKELGTGAVKVTPAHDPNDYACGLRNDLEMINILNSDGTLNENADRFAGMDRYAARDAVVEGMRELGHFVEVEQRTIPLKKSDRSKTPIEPYLSDQWFVKMDELAQSAIDAVSDGKVRFYPSRYEKTYLDWLGEKRDWCISRQLWWGHRIPVWTITCATAADLSRVTDHIAGDEHIDSGDLVHHVHGNDAWNEQTAAIGEPYAWVYLCCDELNEDRLTPYIDEFGAVQEDDVLDTWFSSALWPHETLGWPDTDHNPPLNGEADPDSPSDQNAVLDYFYPTSVLITSRDIITLWVARMVLAGLYNMGDVPFAHVHVHPKILDGFGRTMSKSKGNGVNPLDLIDRYGTDAVRFTIASLAGETQDVKLPVDYEDPETGETIPQTIEHTEAKPEGGVKPRITFPKSKRELQYTSPNYTPDEGETVARTISERFEYGRNFCNKLWNAARFAMLNLEGYTPGEIDTSDLPIEDAWILSRLTQTSQTVTECLGRYQFDYATKALRDFVWNEFCDWYLEMIKPRLRDEERKPAAQRMLVGVLDAILKLLSPWAPFITEELWQTLKEIAPQRGLPAPEQAAEAVVIAPWPGLPEAWHDSALERRFESLQETIAAVRNVRGMYNIPPTTNLTLYVRCDAETAADFESVSGQFENLARTMLKATGANVERPPASASFTLGEADGFVPLEGVIDTEEELKRQRGEAEALRGRIASQEKRLSNENFTSKAPPEVVQGARDQLESMRSQLASVAEIIVQLEQ